MLINNKNTTVISLCGLTLVISAMIALSVIFMIVTGALTIKEVVLYLVAGIITIKLIEFTFRIFLSNRNVDKQKYAIFAFVIVVIQYLLYKLLGYFYPEFVLLGFFYCILLFYIPKTSLRIMKKAKYGDDAVKKEKRL